MKAFRHFLSYAFIAVGIYAFGYFVSVKRNLDFQVDSSQLKADGHITLYAKPTFRFLDFGFWRLAHKCDVSIRPKYWSQQTFDILPAAINQPILKISPSTSPLNHRIFPTL